MPASVVRNVSNAISNLRQEDEQAIALQNLSRFRENIGSGRRRDVGWGLIVTDTQDFVRLQRAPLNKELEPGISDPHATSSAGAVTEGSQPPIAPVSETDPATALYPGIWEQVKTPGRKASPEPI